MAQRAIIGINGDLLPFDETLDKLQTQAIGGGSVTWVPEADTRCTALTVTENGSKSASDEGVYGWDYVAVSVPGSSVTGIDPATGQETTVTVNPETGDIVKTVVPVEIRVTTLPTKTDYTNGETIDYSGIVVHAYSSTGEDLGAVPFGELVFPVTTAHNESGQNYATSELNTGAFTQPIPLSNSGMFIMSDDEYIQNKYTYMPINGGIMIIRYNTISYTELVYASKNQSEALLNEYEYTNDRTGEQSRRYDSYTPSLSYTAGGKTVYYNRLTHGHTQPGKYAKAEPIVNGYGTQNEDYVRAAAWTAIYGTIIGEDQSLPVQWPRPDDGAILETSFNINVTGGAA